jgi:hypothetical protein
MDLFYGVFSNEIGPLRLARNLALNLADKAGPSRRWRYAMRWGWLKARVAPSRGAGSMNKALLVIDFINDIAHPDGRIAASAAHVLEQDAIAHANQALAHARAHGWLVVLIKVGLTRTICCNPRVRPCLAGLTSSGRSRLATAAPTFTPTSTCSPGSGADQAQGQPFTAPRWSRRCGPTTSTTSICAGEYQLGHSGGGAEGHDRDYAITILRMPARRRMPRTPCLAAHARPHRRDLKVAQLA